MAQHHDKDCPSFSSRSHSHKTCLMKNRQLEYNRDSLYLLKLEMNIADMNFVANLLKKPKKQNEVEGIKQQKLIFKRLAKLQHGDEESPYCFSAVEDMENGIVMLVILWI